MLITFSSTNSNWLYWPLALHNRDQADSFRELWGTRDENTCTDLLHCWFHSHMVRQLIGSGNKQCSSLNSFFKLQVNSTQIIQTSNKVLTERVVNI